MELSGSRYRIDEKRGSRLFAGTLLGVRGFTRPVALTRVGALDAEAIDELRGAARVHHPVVVAPFDLVEGPGGGYVVSPWVEGLDLSAWRESHERRGEPIPWPLAVHVASEVLVGLAAAHADGLCHPALRPSRVRVDGGGAVHLLGLGEPSGALSPETIAYQPPERMGGTRSPAGDCWTVAAMLHELLCGHRPFGLTEAPALWARIQMEDPRPISDARPDLPQWLTAALARALTKERAERFEDAEEMARSLDAPDATMDVARSVNRARIAASALDEPPPIALVQRALGREGVDAEEPTRERAAYEAPDSEETRTTLDLVTRVSLSDFEDVAEEAPERVSLSDMEDLDGRGADDAEPDDEPDEPAPDPDGTRNVVGGLRKRRAAAPRADGPFSGEATVPEAEPVELTRRRTRSPDEP